MSKIKLLSIAVTGLIIINLVVVGLMLRNTPPHLPAGNIHQPGNAGMPPGIQEGPKVIIMERLRLDKEQVAAYEKLITAHQAAVRELQDSIRFEKNALYRILGSQSDMGKDSLINRINGFQKQMEHVHFDHFNALKKLCRPDQMEYFKLLTDELARFIAPAGIGHPPQSR